jgi:NAD+ synthase
MTKTEDKIVCWLNDYYKNSKINSFIIGVSGGIDSAVTSTLCALTGKKTILVSLPIYQSKAHLKRAQNHIENLKSRFENIESLEIDLSNVLDSFLTNFSNKDQLSEANTRSRLRMVTLYHIASLNNGLVVGTGNKVEDFGVGFYTKYGDGGVDISPIADLLKSEVKRLAVKLNVIQEIIEAKPSDGLWDDDRSDEDQIGASYEELEWAMNYIEQNKHTNLTEREKTVLNIFTKFNTKNRHKMVPIPIFKNE